MAASSKKRKMTAAKTILLILLIVYSASLVLMYLWGFLTSLKSSFEFRKNMFLLPWGAPWNWQWGNYATALNTMYVSIIVEGVGKKIYVFEMLINSLLYSFGGALINVFTTWMIAYLLARFRYKFSKFMYSVNMILMVVPLIGTLPSALQVMKALGLYDNWMFVVINSTGFTGMYLMIFYAFHRGIGKEYTEAAYCDGASNLTIMMRIVFPISASIFFVVLLMTGIARWNDYMTMLIWMPNHPTLAYGIFSWSHNTTTEASWPPMQIAGAMILMIPILIVFLLFQDVMMSNLRIGALKG